jgi:hypothetical protein
VIQLKKSAKEGGAINRKKRPNAGILEGIVIVFVVLILMVVGYIVITKFYEVALPNQPFLMIIAVGGFIGICILVIAKALSSH